MKYQISPKKKVFKRFLDTMHISTKTRRMPASSATPFNTLSCSVGLTCTTQHCISPGMYCIISNCISPASFCNTIQYSISPVKYSGTIPDSISPANTVELSQAVFHLPNTIKPASLQPTAVIRAGPSGKGGTKN